MADLLFFPFFCFVIDWFREVVIGGSTVALAKPSGKSKDWKVNFPMPAPGTHSFYFLVDGKYGTISYHLNSCRKQHDPEQPFSTLSDGSISNYLNVIQPYKSKNEICPFTFLVLPSL